MDEQTEHQQFIMASMNERNKLQTFTTLNPDFHLLKFTSASGYSTFDAFATSGDVNSNWAVEVKVRTFSKSKYRTAFLKVDKYNAIMNKCKLDNYINKNVQPILLNFFTDGYVAIWNLNHVTLDEPKYVRYKLYNVTNSPIVDNLVYELKLNEATFYKWK